MGVTIGVGLACERNRSEGCLASVMVDLTDGAHPYAYGRDAVRNTCTSGHPQSPKHIRTIIADARRIWADEQARRARETP